MKLLRKIANGLNGLRYLGLLFLLFGYASLQLAAEATEDSQGLRGALREARSEITRGDVPVGEIRKRLHSLDESVQAQADSGDDHLRAEIEYLFGALADAEGDPADAKARFENAVRLAELAVEAEPENADARRLLADSFIRLAEHRGKFFGMRVIGRVRGLLEGAHEMQPGDPSTQVSLARFYATAPKALGGDVDTAVALCESALTHGAEIHRFRAYLVLAKAMEEQGHSHLARQAAVHAVEIYPRNRDARALVADLE